MHAFVTAPGAADQGALAAIWISRQLLAQGIRQREKFTTMELQDPHQDMKRNDIPRLWPKASRQDAEDKPHHLSKPQFQQCQNNSHPRQSVISSFTGHDEARSLLDLPSYFGCYSAPATSLRCAGPCQSHPRESVTESGVLIDSDFLLAETSFAGSFFAS